MNVFNMDARPDRFALWREGPSDLMRKLGPLTWLLGAYFITNSPVDLIFDFVNSSDLCLTFLIILYIDTSV